MSASAHDLSARACAELMPDASSDTDDGAQSHGEGTETGAATGVGAGSQPHGVSFEVSVSSLAPGYSK